MNKDIIKRCDDVIMQNFLKYDIVMEKSYDSTLVDCEGKEYIDFLSGIGVASLGYSNKKFKEALKEQIDNLIHTSNFFTLNP